MKIILDENIPKALKRYLFSYEVTTVQEQGWAGIKNGELIAKIDDIYDKMEKDHKNVLVEIHKVNTTLEKVEKSLDDRLKKVEDDQANTNLKLAAVAAGILVIGFVIQNSGFFAKVLSEEEKALTNPTHPAMIEPKAR